MRVAASQFAREFARPSVSDGVALRPRVAGALGKTHEQARTFCGWYAGTLRGHMASCAPPAASTTPSPPAGFSRPTGFAATGARFLLTKG